MIHNIHPMIFPRPSKKKGLTEILHEKFVSIEHFFEHGLRISETSSEDTCYPGF